MDYFKYSSQRQSWMFTPLYFCRNLMRICDLSTRKFRVITVLGKTLDALLYPQTWMHSGNPFSFGHQWKIIINSNRLFWTIKD